ncbi:uncharacterized protein NDAI_0F00850 [Naumovozyma dairenensis CBS 421]|uniref:MULE transposase domain-containing protein n=1 Tax=Naumovozyma dairenensis (strain ATCC 10597 / BCRC 20456 / CBS 421 / NBRC 0211 / NRRL Y-12639) TaxID=1071378 RepID=G0WC93_NAUDC|nr:hypothetical protein NDAI_0F00850 [Naumovozyma dairenensis CBS 421]CCD25404.1 hypothetical protein NDAI_0F00850 [Naumovozyma dairenensis CBS 421]
MTFINLDLVATTVMFCNIISHGRMAILILSLRINRVMEALVTTSRPLSQIFVRSTNTRSIEENIKGLVSKLISDFFNISENFDRIEQKRVELAEILGKDILSKNEVVDKQNRFLSNAIKTALQNSGLGAGNRTSEYSSYTMVASISSLLVLYGDFISIGMFFTVDEEKRVFGNIDYPNVGGTVIRVEDEDIDEERQDGEVVDEGLSEELEDVLKDNNREHLMTGSGSFNVMKQCFSRQGLFPAAKMTTVHVTPDVNGVAMDKYIRDSLKYISNNIEPDSLFIATKLLNPNLGNKFAGIFLIDDTFLRGHFKNLINIVGLTTDYRSIPLAHLFTASHEASKACRIAIQLLKRNVDLDCSAANFICDQGKGPEAAIREEHGKEALTLVTRLSKNLIRNAKGRVIEAFQAATHTLDPQVYEESINELIEKFPESKRNSGNSTFKKLTENPRSFSRLKRDYPHWEIFTTNPVEQSHSIIKVLKRGSLVNMIVNLTSFQISCQNKLFLENKKELAFTVWGAMYINCVLALALCFTVVSRGNSSFEVSYDNAGDVSLLKVNQPYCKFLSRDKRYAQRRRDYIHSLMSGPFGSKILVTSDGCQLCKHGSGYLKCPHEVAVVLSVELASSRYEMLETNRIDAVDFLTLLVERIGISKIIEFAECASHYVQW